MAADVLLLVHCCWPSKRNNRRLMPGWVTAVSDG